VCGVSSQRRIFLKDVQHYLALEGPACQRRLTSQQDLPALLVMLMINVCGERNDQALFALSLQG
jgi:hypothetical protein